MENNSLEEFIENLAKEIFKGEELDPEVFQQIQADLLDSAENIINRELIDALTDEKLTEFNIMFDNDASDEEIQSFLAENIDNIDEIVLNALLELKAQYIKREID